MSPKLKPEVAAVSRWLDIHWNPIGDVPPGEYDSYSLPLYGMLVRSASAAEIAERLAAFQDGMGLPRHPDELLAVAERMIEDFARLRS